MILCIASLLFATITPRQLADRLISQMTLEEKVSQTMDDSPAIARLGIPAYAWWNEGLHGVARAGLATVFPQSIGRAASFDADLERRIGRAVGIEARAKFNLFRKKGFVDRYCGLTIWSPNVNMFRDPRWGRGQETFGEDPFLSGTLGCAFVKGLQGDDPNRLLTAACAKHFLVHSGPEPGRRIFNAVAAIRDLNEYYLPAFRQLVSDAKVADVMTSYNRINGVPATASKEFIEGLLRQNWGHDGYVSSDFGAVEALFDDHRYATSRVETVAAAMNAGVDLCAGRDYTNLVEAVRRGLVSEARLNESVRRLFEIRARLGILPGQKSAYDSLGAESVAASAHRALALESAEKSIVLLENRRNVLPLRKEEIRFIMIGGPLSTDETVLMGNYHGYSSRMMTVVGGVCEVAGAGVKVCHDAEGCELTGIRNPSVGTVAFEGKKADVVIACVGYSPALEGEEADLAGNGNGDRVKFSLPGRQLEYLKSLRSVCGDRPLIAVVFGGSPINCREIAESVDAVLLAWYPGEEGGRAIARVLFGECNPSGCLPFTIPDSYEVLPDIRDYSLPGRTYLYNKHIPQYPFGYGLSYSSFSYSDGKVAGREVSVRVRNDSTRAGDEIVQLYVRSPSGAGDRRVCRLAGFRRVSLAAGESTRVSFMIPDDALLVFREDGTSFIPQEPSIIFLGGGQPGVASGVSLALPWQ